MKKILLISILTLTTLFIGCNSKVDESSTFDNAETPAVISGVTDDNVATYYVNSGFSKNGEYALELSVCIPNEDGTTNLELLNSKKVKMEKDNNLLVDGFLIKEIEEKVKEKTDINYKELKYQVEASEYKNGKEVHRIGSTFKLFDNNSETS